MTTFIPWYVLQTKPRSERKVENLLAHKGYECFVPTYRQKRQWSDRVVEIELPLFPMYIFCRFNPSTAGKAISTPGVTRIVGFGGQPVEVEIREIEALQLLVQSSLMREPWAYIPDGSLVQVETGPLAGAQGFFCSRENTRRLLISVTLLQRSVSVQLEENTVVTVVEVPKKDKGGFSSESTLALRLIKKAKGDGV